MQAGASLYTAPTHFCEWHQTFYQAFESAPTFPHPLHCRPKVSLADVAALSLKSMCALMPMPTSCYVPIYAHAHAYACAHVYVHVYIYM